jgi:Fe-S cluster assembly protein SufD
MESPNQNILSGYLNQFSEAEKKFAPQFSGLKKDALDSFKRLGFPTTKFEEWKYTSVAELLKSNFNFPLSYFALTLKDIQNYLPEEANPILLVFENGKFNKDLSRLNSLPSGITVGNIKEFTNHEQVQKHLGKIAEYNKESFVALNTAMFLEGAFIFADKNINCEKPVHLLFVNDSRQTATISYPRNLIVADKGSTLKITESYYSIEAINPSFCNPVTEIYVDDNANLEFCKNESENPNDFHVDYTSVVLRRDSIFNIHTITCGGNLTRNNLRIDLQDRNGSAFLNGLYITSDGSHIDNHSVVNHASPDCYSNELYKGLLNGKSHGVFNGKIYVAKDAQKTNAFQSNKTIILSDEASMNSKPQLEIYADDVKCSHGATTGQIDNEAMFYLRARGIGEDKARALLTNAFAEEILDKITIPEFREKIKDLIHGKLLKGN